MKIAKKTKKNILFGAASLLVVAAIVLAIVLPIMLNREEDIGYSYEEENKPIEYPFVESLVFNQKISNTLKSKFNITDNSNHIGNFLLTLLSRARIPTEKLNSFANYTGDFFDAILNGWFDIPDQENDDYGVISAFEYQLNMFFEKTDFTEIELARFLYELTIVITADTAIRDILIQLGRQDFVTYFTNSLFTFKMLGSGLEVSAYEARALQGMMYSLGFNYLTMLDKIGYRNTERLLGFNYEKTIDETNMNEEQWEIYSSAMQSAQFKVANLVEILSTSMMNTNAYGFELLSIYMLTDDKNSNDSKKYKVLSHIEIAKAIRAGISASYENSQLTGIENDDELKDAYATLIADYNSYMEVVYQEEELADYDEFKQQAYENIDNFLDCVDRLSSIEGMDFENISQNELDELDIVADGIGELTKDMEEYYDLLMSTLIANLLSNIINLDSLIENNQKEIGDIIRDTMEGLMNIEDLEDYLEISN